MDKFHYAYDEICIAASFNEKICLYGIPAGSLQTQAKRRSGKLTVSEIERAERAAVHLKERVVKLVKQMEKKRLLIVEPGGSIYLDSGMSRVVNCIGMSDKMGYVSFLDKKRSCRIYLYYRDGKALAQESDKKDGGWFYLFDSLEETESFLTDKLKECNPETTVSLLMEKKGTLYETAFDRTWDKKSDGAGICQEITEALWKG